MARSLRYLLRAAGFAFFVVLALAAPVAAAGWFYLLRGVTAPGPRLPDVLPLDELPNRAAVDPLQFVLVWALAALALGLVARAARVERLVAALLTALLVGSVAFAVSGISILVVRQIPTGVAFKDASRLAVVYVAAAIAATGGALLGARTPGKHWPTILAVFVAVSGVLDIASAVTPAIASRLALVEDATPNVVPHLAAALVVPAGLVLIVLARGLRRRRRRAWQLTLALVVAAAVLHLLKGLDAEEAAVNLLLALALVARRHDFTGPGDPRRRANVVAWAVLWFGAVFAYGAAALWINRVVADQPYTLAFAAKETAESLVGGGLVGTRHVGGEFGHWFPLSVLLLGVVGALGLLWAWLAPWRYRISSERREHAHELVDTFGVDTLAPFALRADKTYFFSEDELAFLAYKVVAGVAVISGDPVGLDASVQTLLPRFLAYARARDWRVAVLGAGERFLDLYRSLGLRVLYHGDEAVVDSAGFSLEGRAIRKVRQSVTRLARQGYRADVEYAGSVDEETRADLEDVFDEWRGDAPTKGFTMELDTLFRLDGDDAVFVIGRDRDGTIQGFLHFVVTRPSRALSLSSMPRRAATPNGFNEWLVAAALEWAGAHGLERVSLNFAPFAAVFDPDAAIGRAGRVQRRALGALKGHGFQLENLLAFNRKFFPRWERRYVVYERRSDLPRVGLAGLAAEGYLPLIGARQ